MLHLTPRVDVYRIAGKIRRGTTRSRGRMIVSNGTSKYDDEPQRSLGFALGMFGVFSYLDTIVCALKILDVTLCPRFLLRSAISVVVRATDSRSSDMPRSPMSTVCRTVRPRTYHQPQMSTPCGGLCL